MKAKFILDSNGRLSCANPSEVTVISSEDVIDFRDLGVDLDSIKIVDFSDCCNLVRLEDNPLLSMNHVEQILLPDGIEYVGTYLPSSLKYFIAPASLKAVPGMNNIEMVDLSRMTIKTLKIGETLENKISNSTVILPCHLEEIGDDCIINDRYDPKVRYVYAPKTVRKIGTNVFRLLLLFAPKLVSLAKLDKYDNSDIGIYVMPEYLDEYKAKAEREGLRTIQSSFDEMSNIYQYFFD